MDYSLYLSGPAIDVGLSNWPELRGDTIYGLRPKQRLALWVEMTPPPVDPVCGMAHEDDFIRHDHKGRQYAFCSNMCFELFTENPEAYEGMDSVRGEYTLAFYDTRSNRPVLRVPIEFKGKEEGSDGGGHQH